jgi:D-glycero-alpha-D-manno-heptose-7-phosphate kinase
MLISRAPLRVSFLGGGTDFPEYFREHGGAVLATAIDKFSYVTASPFHSHLFNYAVRISYSKGELVKNIDEISHPVFRECLRLCGFGKDIELHTVADLPAFTGLGSSSSFTVALLQALHAYKGEFVTPLQLAYEAIHIERNVLKECVGVQDQTTAAVGGFNVLEFRKEDDIRVNRLPLSPARLEEINAHFFLVFTGITRRAHDVEAQKLQKLSDNKPQLHHLRGMVDEGYSILVSGSRSLSEFGQLLHRGWQLKRGLDKQISNSEIDVLYDRGMAAGAWGGKLLGAGGGGFLLFMVPPENRPKLAAALSDKHEVKVHVGAPGSQVIFAS